VFLREDKVVRDISNEGVGSITSVRVAKLYCLFRPARATSVAKRCGSERTPHDKSIDNQVASLHSEESIRLHIIQTRCEVDGTCSPVWSTEC